MLLAAALLGSEVVVSSEGLPPAGPVAAAAAAAAEAGLFAGEEVRLVIMMGLVRSRPSLEPTRPARVLYICRDVRLPLWSAARGIWLKAKKRQTDETGWLHRGTYNAFAGGWTRVEV